MVTVDVSFMLHKDVQINFTVFQLALGCFTLAGTCVLIFFLKQRLRCTDGELQAATAAGNSDIAILAKITTQVRYQFLTDLL